MRLMSVRYAGFWIRAVAAVLDYGILNIASWIIQEVSLRIVYLLMRVSTGHSGGNLAAFADAFNPLFVEIYGAGIYILLAFPYYVWWHFRYGRTPGKWPFSIQVVNGGGFKPITLKQSILRCIGYAVSYAPFGTGYLMAAFHPEKRALHDLIAGTVCVRRVRTVAPFQPENPA